MKLSKNNDVKMGEYHLHVLKFFTPMGVKAPFINNEIINEVKVKTLTTNLLYEENSIEIYSK